jgi:hypothetical protein
MSVGLAARAALAVADLLYRRPFLEAARDPRQTQERTLRQMLSANADTEFGRTHGFGQLTSGDAYRAAVPVQTHDSLCEAIRRQAETGAQALTMAQPVFYARTSGTTGPARDFPVTVQAQVAQRVAQRIFAATLRRGTGLFEGRIAGFSGAHVEGRLPGGQPYGSASGQTYASAPAFVRDKFVVPEMVFDIADASEKYHAYALSALAADDLTGIITANPSTLLSVFTHVRRYAEAVLRDLSDGTFTVSGTVSDPPGKIAANAMAKAQARPDRAKALEAVLGQGLPLGQVWPRLNTLATWTGGNCRVALDQLRPMLPPEVQMVEIGYRASEFIGTINIEAATNLCLPDIGHTVFEFVEEDRWERGDAAFLWLDEIDAGRRYYVFATTPSGLYRYHINDVVEVTGHAGACPTLGFVRKGQGATSITGEKLYETQAMDAACKAARATGIPPAFFIAVADPKAAIYRLFHEIEAPPSPGCVAEAASVFDAALCASNIEYAAKRSSGRLSPAEVVFVRPDAGEAVKAAAIAAGQREAQVKPPLLVDAARWRFDFAPYRWDREE